VGDNSFTEERRLILIDLDVIAFKVACEKKQDDYTKAHFGDQTMRTQDDVARELDQYMNNLFKSTKATHYLGFLTVSKSFRYDIYPEYKATRKQEKPAHLNFVKECMVNKYGAISIDKLEADDLLVICHHYYEGSILVSTDKDMLQSPGIHYNPSKDKYTTVTKDEADYNLWFQVIVGDSTDNIKGLPKVGEKTAPAILANRLTEATRADQTFSAYLNKLGEYQGILEFTKNYRLIKLLTQPDYGFEIPEPHVVIKEVDGSVEDW
jgi:5'-3' exonuclease